LEEIKNPKIANEVQINEFLKTMSYRHVIMALFTSPLRGVLVAGAKKNWIKGILMLFLCGFIAGTTSVVMHFSDYVQESKNVIVFASGHLGDISFKNGKLLHTKKVPEHVTGFFSFGRIDLYGAGEKVEMPALSIAGDQSRGIVISDAETFFWQTIKGRSGENSIDKRDTPEQLFLKIEEFQKAGTMPKVLTSAFLLKSLPAFGFVLAPVFVLIIMTEYAVSMLFYTMLLAIVLSSMRRGLLHLVGHSFTIAVHGIIPPYVVALIYSVLIPARFSFIQTFWIALMVYVIYAIWEARSNMKKYAGRYIIGTKE